MSSNSDGGHKVGIFGAGVLAVGALFARLADDCARVGVHGASLVDDGARGLGRGAALADDGARNLGRGSSLTDDGARNLGPAARLTDDAPAGASIYGPPTAVTEDSARLIEVSRGGDAVAEGSSLEVAKIAVDLSLEVVPNLAEPSPRGPPASTRTPAARLLAERAVTDHPVLLALLPISTRAYKYVYGKRPDPPAIAALVDAAGTLPEPGSAAQSYLSTFLSAQVTRNPIGLVAYAHGDIAVDGAMVVVLPDGGRLEDAQIHHACLQRGDNCVLLICPPESKLPGACTRAAAQIWETAVQAHPQGGEPMPAFLARLFDARDANQAAWTIVVSRLASDDKGALNLVRSRIRDER